MSSYGLTEKVAKAIVIVWNEYGRQVWTRIRLRKIARCASCRIVLKKGDQAYRPITNGANRMHRLCLSCVGDEDEHQR